MAKFFMLESRNDCIMKTTNLMNCNIFVENIYEIAVTVIYYKGHVTPMGQQDQ